MLKKDNEAWLIVGLGNPGPEYAKTRHNCGFRALDILAQKLGCKVDKGKFEGLYGQTTYEGHKLYLLKPLTYMNLSGRSVLQLSAYFNIPPQRIVVIFDDISLAVFGFGATALPGGTTESNPSSPSWEVRTSPG